MIAHFIDRDARGHKPASPRSPYARGVSGPRVAIVLPCFNGGALVREAAASVAEPEPVELVVVDDASSDRVTVAALAELERDGVRVVRLPSNVGLAGARNAGLRATEAPYVFPLDADDLLLPGVLSVAADRLDAAPAAAACVGDYQEFGHSSVTRAVPARLDPYRVAYTNEYPVLSLFRRTVLERLGGWRDPFPAHPGYEDWNLWMDLAEAGAEIVHLGATMYRRRLADGGLNASARTRHAELYRALRAGHAQLFAQLDEHRRRSDLSPLRRALYPIVYGDRRLLGRARAIKPLLDRTGIWTLRR
jgi:glycosyltransferase involved in cell wall biosynthesis